MQHSAAPFYYAHRAAGNFICMKYVYLSQRVIYSTGEGHSGECIMGNV